MNTQAVDMNCFRTTRRSMNRAGLRGAVFAACASLGLVGQAEAQFAASVTPPRFEVSVDAGQVSRQVMEITHALPGSGVYRVYTNDWGMNAGGALTFYDTLQPGSCRPWVTIERKEVTVTMGTRVRYRFEVAPPASVTPTECRFAVMVEGKPQDIQTGAASTVPMSGRIAVIVYVSVGGAKAVLEPGATSVGQFEGQATPTLSVRNSGTATGRLAGIISGTDAAGTSFEFSPETVPVLPGQTRQIALQLYAPGRRAAQAASAASGQPQIKWPLTLRGALEYGSGGNARFELDRTIGSR
jgi:hypothetical protein